MEFAKYIFKRKQIFLKFVEMLRFFNQTKDNVNDIITHIKTLTP